GFLGKFEVPNRTRVLLLSGESGQATLQETAERVCRQKIFKLSNVDVIWNFDLPQLTRDRDVARLRRYVEDNGGGVVIPAPLYLAMTGLALSAANFFAVGPLLRRCAQACLEAGATPILVHHTGKTAGMQRASAGQPLELTDLAYAGFAEFARQWVLVSRRE